jgi:dsDNA-binding SOS-regulon protein
MTDIHSCSYFCTRPACVLAQRDELRDKMLVQTELVDKWLTDDLPQVDKEQAEPVSALTRYNEIAEDVETTCNALERLRIFCSLAMTKEDWLDAEPFFDAAEAELTKLDVRLAEIDRLKQQAEPMGGEVERLMSVLEIQDATITALSAAQQAKPIDWVCDWVWDYVEPQQAKPVADSGNPSY